MTASLKRVRTPTLEIGYEDSGPAAGTLAATSCRRDPFFNPVRAVAAKFDLFLL